MASPRARVCLCPACCATPAFSYTDQHRRQCEARYVLGKGREQRQAYYASVEKFRGREAALQLIDDVNRERARA